MMSVALMVMTGCGGDDPPEPEGFVVVKHNPVEVVRRNPMHIMVHYMPWFEDKTSSGNGNWGIHWTMATRNPDLMDNNGKREIASHYYPQIGPYSSGDHDVLEYHLLLMKYSGITGVLIDWYGSSDVYDYPGIRANSEALISLLKEVGLDFAIVYEDRTVDPVVSHNSSLDALGVAQEDMLYLEEHYFNHDRYIRIDHRPLLMVFGPEKFHDPDEWSEILSVLPTEPLFLILNGKSSQTAPSSSGEYIWVNNTPLDTWYNTAHNFDYFMGGAYPGFVDYYEEGGWGDGFTWQIEHNDGQVFEENLQKAADHSMEYLQLITWNDFGEGTMIEPTLEFGYTFLESVQEFADIDYTAIELEYIHKLYLLRKENAGDGEIRKMLDQSFYYLASLQTEKAFHLLDSLYMAN